MMASQRQPQVPPALLAVSLHVVLFLFLFFEWHQTHPSESMVLQPQTEIIKATAVSPDQLIQLQKAQLQKKQEQAAQAAKREQQLLKERELAKQAQEKAKALELARQEKAKQQAAAAKEAAQQKAAQSEKTQQSMPPPLVTKSTQTPAQNQTKQNTKEPTPKPANSAEKKEDNKSQETQKKREQKAAEALKTAEQKEMESQMAAEKKALTAAKTTFDPHELDQYKALIIGRIHQAWIVPTDVNPDISCELLVEVSPQGQALKVEISRSSGDLGLDHSAQAAVYKAVPLPVPSDPKLFSQFRELRIKMSPGEINQAP